MTTIVYGVGDSITFGFGLTAHAAWAGSTTYTAIASDGTGSFVANGGHYYACVRSGTSANSGGPSGTGLAIADGGATWAHLGTSSSVSTPNWLVVSLGILLAQGKSLGLDNEAFSGSSALDWVGSSGTAGSWWFLAQKGIDSSAAKRIVVISLGTNDFSKISGGTAGYTNYNGAQVLANVGAIARQAEAMQCQVVLTDCMLTSNFTDSVNGNGLTAYNDFQAQIGALCSAHGYTKIGFQAINGSVAKQDGTHPTAAGARTLAALGAPLIGPLVL